MAQYQKPTLDEAAARTLNLAIACCASEPLPMMEADRRALKAIAIDFLEGRLTPLDAALALMRFEDEAPGEIRSFLTTMVAVASEMDDIPLGERRELWHPNVRAVEDKKHDAAQQWAEPMVRETCEALVASL